jgi:large subunit ribosomal protein L13
MRGTLQKSYVASAKTFKKEWWIVDATNQTLGRMATRIAMVLMGKHKPTYTPFLDTGDHVVIINCEKVRLTGKKPLKKVYKRFSGYPGGQVELPFATWFAKNPAEVVRHAVVDMLPRHGMGRRMIFKLNCYKGTKHPHGAQQPKELKLDA